jgi:tRNA G18 (ribose-2'-O)-methylase SpoU
MPVILLEDIHDSRLDVYRHLRHPDRRLHHRYFVAEGMLLVERLLRSRFQVQSIVSIRRMLGTVSALVDEQISVFAVPDGSLNDLVGFRFHRGVLGCGVRERSQQLSSVAGRLPQETLVICPEIQDPENLGGLLRGIAALQGNGILLGPACPDAFSRRVLRVSMGASLIVPTVVSSDLERDFQWLSHDAGYELWAAVLEGSAERLSTVAIPPRVGLVLGREDKGLSPATVRRCNRTVTIPMPPETDSLNLAMTGTIMLYDLREKRCGESSLSA